MPTNETFHEWVRTAPDWVIVLAQSDTACRAMQLAFEAGREQCLIDHGRFTRIDHEPTAQGGKADAT